MANERTMVTRWKSVVDPSVKKAAEEVGQTSDTSSKKSTAAWAAVGSAIGNLAARGISMLADAAKDFVADSLRAGSALQQSSGAVEAVFKKDAAAIVESGTRAADALGLSRNEYQELATTLGAGLKNKGLKDYADQSQNLIKVGADLAAQYGGSTSDAVSALASLMRGERDPIERYGVTMNEAMVQAEAFALGLAKPAKNMDLIKAAQNKAVLAQRTYTQAVKEHGKGSDEALAAEAKLLGAQSRLGKVMEGTTPKLTDQQKAQASLSLLTKQTADAQGAFAREADTAAGAQARMQAKAENLKAAIGTKLLPIQTKLFEVLHKQVIPAVQNAVTWFEKNKSTLVPLVTVVGSAAGVLGGLAIGVKTVTAATNAWQSAQAVAQVATKAWSAGQAALNLVMSANPIGLVVIAVAALVAGIVVAYQQSKTFRDVVDAAFSAIGAAGTWLWNNALKPAIQAMVLGFAWVVDGVAAFLAALGTIPGFEWAKDASKGLEGIAAQARAAADGMNTIPDAKNSTVTATDAASEQLSAIDTKLQALKDKQVTARANGDYEEVKRLQNKIDDLKDKRIDIEAKVKKTGVSTIKLVAGSSDRLSVVAVARGGIFPRVGGRARAFANGGVENHTAQIAPAGAMRLWAEPETGGEAYIPLADTKRGRSIPLWWETGRRLGVVKHADGAVYGSSRGAATDPLAEAILRLASRVLTREDMQALMDELRRVVAAPRPATGVRLG